MMTNHSTENAVIRPTARPSLFDALLTLMDVLYQATTLEGPEGTAKCDDLGLSSYQRAFSLLEDWGLAQWLEDGSAVIHWGRVEQYKGHDQGALARELEAIGDYLWRWHKDAWRAIEEDAHRRPECCLADSPWGKCGDCLSGDPD